MKTVCSIILALIGTVSFASSSFKSPEYVPMFEIVSDSLDSKVPASKCLITGIITRQGEVVNEATIYNNIDRKVNSNKLGHFRMLVDTASKYLVIHKGKYPDAYVENYPFANQHHIHMKIFMPDKDEMIMVEKPVIYVYGSSNEEITLEIKTDVELDFTYPAIDDQNKWDFTTDPKGNLTVGNQNYPYLFWEGKTNTIFNDFGADNTRIFVVKTDTIVNFLESYLSSNGFSPTERADFITYWGPRLTQKPFAAIEFLENNECNLIAELVVSPTPDQVSRVYMVYSSFESEPSGITPKEYNPSNSNQFSREQLTVVEWGGFEVAHSYFYKKL